MAEAHRAVLSSTSPSDDVLGELAAVMSGNADSIAVIAADGILSYAELWTSASDLATRLNRSGVLPGDLVALVLPSSSASVVAMVAVLLAQAAYVPLELGDSTESLTRAARVGARVVVTVGPDGVWPEIIELTAPPGSDGRSSAPVPEGLAYVLFTSGTTGTPRAVAVTRANLAFSTRARRAVYPSSETFLLLSPTHFDSSVAGIWGTLTVGATLVVASDDQRRDPYEIVRLIERHEIGRTLMIPSLYREVLAGEHDSTRLRSLREVIVAGERLPDALISAHFEKLPSVDLVNEYGPTEATVWATYRRYGEMGPSTIGRAAPGVKLAVVDNDGQPVVDGSPGELLIGGGGVTVGYLGDAESTQRSFVVLDELGDVRWYRTGDNVRREGAELLYLGRFDRQVKVRGRRIELDAVEVAWQAVPGVAQAAAQVSEEGAYLIAHLVLQADVIPATVVAAVHEVQPDWLRPGAVVIHSRLPVTANGKVDVAALRAAVFAQPPVADGAVPAAATDLERLVIEAWHGVLGRDEVPTDANFFDLGGNSMLMIRLQRRLVAATGKEIPVVALFQHATVAAQVAMLSADHAEDGAESAVTRAERARLARARRRRQEGV